MEVLVGPTFGMDAAKDKHARLFLNAEDGAAAVGSGPLTRALALNGKAPPPRAAEDSSETSSSIGAPDDSDEENDDDDDDNEAQSKFRGGSLASLESLEDSLPIKRGLSNHFSGKSKSFASLADVCTVSDLKKTENPLNKRRRLLIASKWSKKSFYSWANPKSMPLLALQEDDDDDDDDAADQHHAQGLSKEQEQDRHDHHGRDDDDDQARCLPKFNEKRRLRSFKTSFSLADLQGHSLLEDHDDDNN